MKNKYIRFIISILVPQVAGLIGSAFTNAKIPTWYSSLEKSSLNPPSWVFGPVWTTLYLLMGIALYIIWTKSVEGNKVRLPLVAFGVQLVLNSLWSIVFFGFKSPFVAFIVIILLWASILWTIILFYKASRPAGLMLIPYILWVSFAAYLNYSIWILN